MSEPAFAIGQIVSGTYRIVRRVGGGGMGDIYEVTHTRLAGRYAMKFLRAEIAANSDASARFQREAKVTSALQHPNIVQVIDFNALDGGPPYLVMEFLDGPELAQIMKRGGPLPLPQVLSYVKQIAAGLMAAHERKIVHRDLKPQNIFVLSVIGHGAEVIKIVDFGISKAIEASTTVTSPLAVLGTVHYMSPEQARGRVDEIDARTDQFSFAVIVYEMLTGQDAFQGDDVSSLVYQIVHEEPPALSAADGPIPPAVASVLKRALAKDKERRFSTIGAFATALEEAAAAGADVTGKTISTTADALDGPARRQRVRRRAGGVAALLALAVFGALYARRGAPPPTVDKPGLAETISPSVSPTPPASPADAVVDEAPPTTPKVGLKRSALRSRQRSEPAPSAPAPARASCTPNYYLDAQGDKHFKKECFLKEPAGP